MGVRTQMIRVVTRGNAGRYARNLYEMHRLRKMVFKDRLGWNVTVSGELEVDEYDLCSRQQCDEPPWKWKPCRYASSSTTAELDR
jgi:hypothetical protein